MNERKDRAVRSWPTQEQLLAWRIEDLEGRLCELTGRLPNDRMDEKFDRRFYSRLADPELDCRIPAQLYTVEDVLTAIARAKDRLWSMRCDARAAQKAAEKRDQLPGQIVLFGFAAPAERLAERLAS